MERKPLFFASTSGTSVQKPGYLIEEVLKNDNMANGLFKASKENELEFFRIPLKPSASIKGFSSDNRWKVIVNVQIEMDE